MVICNVCGTSVQDGVQFCPTCGASLQPTTPPAQNNFAGAMNNFTNTPDSTSEYDPQDIANNKVMAILAYLGILVLIPIFAAQNSKFARYHANQGLVLAIAGVALSVASSVLNGILLVILPFVAIITSLLTLAISIGFLVFAIMGIINAVNGVAKELPLIGKFRILK